MRGTGPWDDSTTHGARRSGASNTEIGTRSFLRRLTTAGPNPTHLLDYERFSSDELLDHFRAERDLLNRLSPGVPVTTNFMVNSHFAQADYWTWAPEQDLISQDHYLDGRLSDPTAELSFSADLTRGLAGGGPWFLMEHSTSSVNWQPINYAKTPGQLLRNSLTHVARGADAVGFFQWRASYAGAEQFHSALLPHAGTDTKVWRESVELGAILGRLGDLVGTRVVAEVAVLYDWQARWACDQPNHLSAEVRYVDQPLAVHAALRALGVTTDLIGPASDLSGYRLVVVPGLFLADDAFAAALHTYVEGGGHATRDVRLRNRRSRQPRPAQRLSGSFHRPARDQNRGVLPAGVRARVGVSLGNGFGEAEHRAWTGSIWTEDTDLRGATALARYTDGSAHRSTGSHATRVRTRRGVVRGNPARPWSHALAFRARLP